MKWITYTTFTVLVLVGILLIPHFFSDPARAFEPKTASNSPSSFTLPTKSPVNISAAPTWKQFLVDVQTVIPDAIFDIRYHTNHNFIGKRIDGYNAAKCLLTPQATQALKTVQAAVKRQGYSLKIHDCYRPQQAVDQFMLWAQDLDDTQAKPEFYPNLDKRQLIPEGYIAEESGHSRGSTVDLTLVRLGSKTSIDMGTNFDLFDPKSNTITTLVTEKQLQNRMVLVISMGKRGFKSLPEEWWHFTLRKEPYPNTFFSFPIE
jgi:D-alanyl-D-alanine dipeptidase